MLTTSNGIDLLYILCPIFFVLFCALQLFFCYHTARIRFRLMPLYFWTAALAVPVLFSLFSMIHAAPFEQSLAWLLVLWYAIPCGFGLAGDGLAWVAWGLRQMMRKPNHKQSEDAV